ncbi:MAG: tetratricopeptide repeat protein [Planctomycetes bacterium]|nr:tetratricopeptide repeat protein [Planctomycetota bacterium]
MRRRLILGLFVLVFSSAAGDGRAQLGELVESVDISDPAASPIQRLVAADDLRISGRYEEAIREYVALVAVPEHRLAATLGRAECLRRMGSYTEALAALNEGSDLGSASADWHVQVAEVMTLTGRYANALERARQAIVLDGDHVSAHYLRGRLLETLGRRDDAIDAYRWFEDRLVRGIPTTAPEMTTVALGYHRHGELTRTDRSPYALHELLQAA